MGSTNNKNKCKLCPINTYQSHRNTLSFCDKCPIGFTTNGLYGQVTCNYEYWRPSYDVLSSLREKINAPTKRKK